VAERPYILLFDGVCAFCDGAVQWLMERDPRGRLSYAPLQGPTAAELRARHPEIPDDIDTMVLVETCGDVETVRLRSDAIFATCELLDPPPAWLPWVRWLPRPLADVAYRIFARLRYRVFGRYDACRVPTPEERERFLD
jgi:predicted DCC family thiol-disulfide oxidoreductase YuxK